MTAAYLDMRITPHITFRLAFKGVASKSESMTKLRNFLRANEWLPFDCDYDTDLLVYHTENNGDCEIILYETPECALDKLADMFFSDIKKEKGIIWAKVLYNPYVDNLVGLYAGTCLYRQTSDLSDLEENDEVIILFRK